MDNTIDAITKARELIKQHEGYSMFPKPDSNGTTQIGYGTNLSRRGIDPGEADWLLTRDVRRLTEWLSSYPFFDLLSSTRKAVLIDMAYNLGETGFAGFTEMIEALDHNEYRAAAIAMLDSEWAAQVGDRAATDAAMMHNG
ncbi:MAG: glycoside hydrolase family protein [Candidatus Binataceae bacterium]|nr:glycoside hydrolase family protein [Candidatus Binataceae bacterium]